MATGRGHSDETRSAIDAAVRAGRDAEGILRGVDETLGAAGAGLGLLADYRTEFASTIQIVNIPADVEVPNDNCTPDAETMRVLAHPLVMRQRQGIRIAVVFGVATSHSLQNLRTVAPEFDEWWRPIQERLRADEVARFFYVLRSVIAKEGFMRATTAPLYFHDGPSLGGHEESSCLDLVGAYLATLGEIVAEAWMRFAPDADSMSRSRPVVDAQATYEGSPAVPAENR